MARRYILACSVFIFCRVDGELLYGLKGLSVSLEPAIPSKPADVTDILWKYNGNKLVEFNGNEQQVYGKFKKRVTLHWHTAELKITELRLEDSGNYDLEATINNKLHRSSKILVVIDKVSKPTISCQMNDSSNSNKSGTLECSAESKDSRTQSLTKFEWESQGNVQRGPQLTISLGGEHDDHVHICNVSNPKSSETTTFTAKDCYPDESSSVALVAGLVTTISLIIVVLGIAVAYLCYRKRKDVEKQAGQTNEVHNTTESQPGVHSPAANQSAGMTVKELAKRFEGEKGGKMNKGKPSPVLPRSVLSPGPAKKEDPADESADLEEKKMSHQEPSAAPESDLETTLSQSGSDQTAAQAEENSTPTDGAATDQEPDRNKDEEMNNDKAPPVPPESAEEEVPESEPSVCEKANKPDQADESADSEKDNMSESFSTGPVESELKKEAEKDGEANVPSDSVFPPSPLTQNSPNVIPENSAGEQSEDVDKPVSTPKKEPVNEEIDE